jgi:Leu/Phe-tRNA-protein transferase
MTNPAPLTIEERLGRIERVLQAVADGTFPWKAARAEFGSLWIAPDAIIPPYNPDASQYTFTITATPSDGEASR